MSQALIVALKELDRLLGIAERANRIELVVITPKWTKLPDKRDEKRAHIELVTEQLRIFMRLFIERAQFHCPVNTGKTRNSITYEIRYPDTTYANAVLFVGNVDRPEVVIRSNLFGRRGFGPKNPKSWLHFIAKDGKEVFTKHVNGTTQNNWLMRAWKEVARDRAAMTRLIGAVDVKMVDVGDVPLRNEPHIDGYDSKRGATVPNTPKWRKAGGQPV